MIGVGFLQSLVLWREKVLLCLNELDEHQGAHRPMQWPLDIFML